MDRLCESRIAANVEILNLMLIVICKRGEHTPPVDIDSNAMWNISILHDVQLGYTNRYYCEVQF